MCVGKEEICVKISTIVLLSLNYHVQHISLQCSLHDNDFT